jgi:hypothetical protein
MPRYFFHVDDGTSIPDEEGTELPDLEAARAESIRAAGAILGEFDGGFWHAGSPWTMHVTDASWRLLFSLQFSAKVPAGEVFYMPRTRPQDGDPDRPAPAFGPAA